MFANHETPSLISCSGMFANDLSSTEISRDADNPLRPQSRNNTFPEPESPFNLLRLLSPHIPRNNNLPNQIRIQKLPSSMSSESSFHEFFICCRLDFIPCFEDQESWILARIRTDRLFLTESLAKTLSLSLARDRETST